MTSAGTARAVYLVLGMHRSGTSALTRALAAFGPDLPAHTMPGDEHNEAGYFESWPIAVLNDQWLRAADSAWDDPFAFPIEPLPEPVNAEWVRKASELFDEEFGDAPRPLLKDPRISLLAREWFELFDQRAIAVRSVISMRRPIAVARSLQRLDGFALDLGVLIWISLLLAAERHYPGPPRFLRVLQNRCSRIVPPYVLLLAPRSSNMLLIPPTFPYEYVFLPSSFPTTSFIISFANLPKFVYFSALLYPLF